MLADWKWKRERKRSIADIRKHQRQQRERALILEWYKLLKPFHRRHRSYGDGKHAELMALADQLSKEVSRGLISQSIFLGSVWTVILALHILFGDWEAAAWLALPGFIGILIFAFKRMKDEMRSRLERYAEGYWVAHDPFTGKQIYFGQHGSSLIKCPQCIKNNYTDHYLRYLEPCEYCGHNIDWEAAKQPNK